jgi:hypothetical protein
MNYLTCEEEKFTKWEVERPRPLSEMKERKKKYVCCAALPYD